MDWNTVGEVALTILGGAGYTIGLFVICGIISIPLGLVLAFLRNSRLWVVQKLVSFYVWVLRGTPLMLQLFFFYFAVPKFAVIGKYLTFGRFETACFAFVINYSAYFCEIFRGAIISVDKGQYEAATALGLSRFTTIKNVVIPQMIKVALPALTNESVTLVKDTSLITTIGIIEITGFAKALVNTTGGQTYPYLIAAALYLLMNDIVMRVFGQLEKKFAFE